MVVLSPRLSALCALLLTVCANAQSASTVTALSSSAPASVSSAVSASSTASELSSTVSSVSASSFATSETSVASITSSLSSVASESFSTLSSFSSAVSGSTAASSSLPASASSTDIASLSTLSSAASASTGPPLESTQITLPISSYGFTSFPVPSASPIPGVFPSTAPKSPPPPGSSLIPDFGPAWARAHSRARQQISGWSLEQKVSVATGVGWMGGRCVGNIAPVADWPGLCLEDSPLGVRFTDFVTAFPAGITTASTWRRDLFRARGLAMGREFKGKGVHVALGPMMNMGRIAQGGRNWEGFGADPFLTGEAAYETVLGLQNGGVQACAKHYINNEQEHFRTQESSNVDDRTEHEIYLHPFMRSVQAGVASVMCSYNLVNDTYACQNDRTLNQLLKDEIGFQGYVMSDWGAHHSTLAAVAGLDMSMPGDITFSSHTSWYGANLTAYVENGTIAESRVDDMAERIIAAYYLLEQDQNYPEVSFNAFDMTDPATNAHVDVQADHYKVVREIGSAGAVLLKNVAGALPLKTPRSIAVIGNDSGPSTRGPNGYSDRGGDDGTLAMGWGSGTTQFPYLVTPLEAIQARAQQDAPGTQVSWWLSNWDTAGAAATAFQQDVALVFVNADSGEDYITVDGNEGDRKNLTLWINADPLIEAVASANPNTVVVVHSVGPAIIEPWIENPNVTAVIWASLPGQESGNAIVDVLWGDVNPSGRLPYTIAKSPADYGAQLITGGTGDEILRIDYTEGLNIDYRHFDSNNIEPRFEFGFGLSYTTFSYSGLHVSTIPQADRTSAALEAAWASGKAAPAAAGGSTALWLHRPAFKVTFQVRNTGHVAGTEIAQLYVHFPAGAGEPPSVLRGFEDVQDVRPGESRTVSITLSRYDLSVWDAEAQGWKKPAGKFEFSVGTSSRDFRLKGTIPV
ncbi:glycoside hydrolase family 3 protein [Trametes coccinea BRFM310]|uniref:beta-glucosidase n=1 Tax=Trametes coccinea (strain BRFM310) TaxID=1353009 RepID=A0A1Y2IRZ2_TRAC3|nr:glycoside hydrolase family 3 protein [Trametes coccinea BRFM310]